MPGKIDDTTWEPVQAANQSIPRYLEISEKSQMINEPFSEGVKFWDSLGLSFKC